MSERLSNFLFFKSTTKRESNGCSLSGQAKATVYLLGRAHRIELAKCGLPLLYGLRAIAYVL